MNTDNIEMVGGILRAKEIVSYQKEYFKHYLYYDVKRKMFSKKIDIGRKNDFVLVKNIESDLILK